MPNDSYILPRSHSLARKKKSFEQLLHLKQHHCQPATTIATADDDGIRPKDEELTESKTTRKKRKFRWSTCFSKLSNKFLRKRSSAPSADAKTYASYFPEAQNTFRHQSSQYQYQYQIHTITEDTLRSNQQQPSEHKRPISTPLLTSFTIHSKSEESTDTNAELDPSNETKIWKQYRNQEEEDERQQRQQSATSTPHMSSLSPPPRQFNRSKRESYCNNHYDTNKTDRPLNEIFPINNTHQRQISSTPSTTISTHNNTSKNPLTDPTLTPRVRPTATVPTINTSSTQRSSLLRLSVESPLILEDVDTSSSRMSSTSSNLSNISFFAPTMTAVTALTPYRSGTLGLIAPSSSEQTVSLSTEPTMASMAMPPLPPPPFSSSNNTSRPHSQYSVKSQFSIVTTPTSMSDVNDALKQEAPHKNSTHQPATVIPGMSQLRPQHEIESIKERRRKRSPLSFPNSEQLTLAMEKLKINEQESHFRYKEVSNCREEVKENRSRVMEAPMKNKKYYSDISWFPEVLAAATVRNDGTGSDINSSSKIDVDQLLATKHKASSVNIPSSERHSSLTTASIKSMVWIDSNSAHGCDDCGSNKRISSTTMDDFYAIVPVNRHNSSYSIGNAHETSTATNHTYSPILTDADIPSDSPPLETPPYHQQTAPSLISALSTPNSFDSFTEEEQEYSRYLLSPTHFPYHHRLFAPTSAAVATSGTTPSPQQ